ncbi:WD domain repeat-containing protein 55 [Rhizophlyctis rosea]|nr:WD domain repeat-containing protein 55 [Rhizophlyctis rosea]
MLHVYITYHAAYSHNYTSAPASKHLFTSNHHKESCRALEFSADGEVLYTASSDKSLQVVNVSTGKVVLKKAKAHSDALNSLMTINETLVASGDDAGCVKLWDTRQRKVAMKYKENVDFIADMDFVSDKRTLLVAGGDGCLSAFDIRKSKPLGVSANQEDELLSIAVVRNTTKVAVGTQSGTLLFFSYGQWGDQTDRFPGHPASIDSIAKIEEQTIFTASSDGIIRTLGIMPNRLIGVCGEHGELPVERIRLTHDKQWVGSCGHDQTIKFWSSKVEEKDEDGDEEEEEDEEEGGEAEEADESEEEAADEEPATPSNGGAPAKRAKDAETSDDSDYSIEEEKPRKKKNKKAKTAMVATATQRKRPDFSGLD